MSSPGTLSLPIYTSFIRLSCFFLPICKRFEEIIHTFSWPQKRGAFMPSLSEGLLKEESSVNLGKLSFKTHKMEPAEYL